jgi:hypothetical protein
MFVAIFEVLATAMLVHSATDRHTNQHHICLQSGKAWVARCSPKPCIWFWTSIFKVPAPRMAPLLVQNGKDRQISRTAHSSLKPGSLGCWLRPHTLHMSLFHPQGAPSIRGVLVRRHTDNQPTPHSSSKLESLPGWLAAASSPYICVCAILVPHTSSAGKATQTEQQQRRHTSQDTPLAHTTGPADQLQEAWAASCPSVCTTACASEPLSRHPHHKQC